MNPFNAAFTQGMIKSEWSFPCGDGTVKIRFDTDWCRTLSALGLDDSISLFEIDTKIVERGPEVLPLITTIVQGVVKSDRQVSARFRAGECPALFEGRWPSHETFNRILRKVTERKQYPLPEPEIPGEGGKSMTAQGQTKKEGSHSHDRHK